MRIAADVLSPDDTDGNDLNLLSALDDAERMAGEAGNENTPSRAARSSRGGPSESVSQAEAGIGAKAHPHTARFIIYRPIWV